MSISAWLHQLDFSYLLTLLLSAAAALLCITVHESAHGLIAAALGDPTAKRAGRISLNPFKHVDFLGLVMLAVAHVGWAKPVPVDMRNFKNPKAGMALTALAGPVSNLLSGFLALCGCVFLPAVWTGGGGRLSGAVFAGPGCHQLRPGCI